MKITAFSGETILIDRDDYILISRFKKWYVQTTHGITYAKAYIPSGNYKTILIHRLIMKPSSDQMIDHINGNGLDNRRCNLRICNRSQNLGNSKKNIKCVSKYKGVDFQKRNNKWRARIAINKKRVDLGLFYNEQEAAVAYNIAALKYFKEFSNLNFIP